MNANNQEPTPIEMGVATAKLYLLPRDVNPALCDERDRCLLYRRAICHDGGADLPCGRDAIIPTPPFDSTKA